MLNAFFLPTPVKPNPEVLRMCPNRISKREIEKAGRLLCFEKGGRKTSERQVFWRSGELKFQNFPLGMVGASRTLTQGNYVPHKIFQNLTSLYLMSVNTQLV
jgi:hypothetical protein